MILFKVSERSSIFLAIIEMWYFAEVVDAEELRDESIVFPKVTYVCQQCQGYER